MTILVKYGADLIGGNVILEWLAQSGETVVKLDKPTYTGNLQILAYLESIYAHIFFCGDFGTNILAVRLLQEHQSCCDGKSNADQISFAADRLGQYRLYAIDTRKIDQELGLQPADTFEIGIRKTVQWYLDHTDWVANVQSGGCSEWVAPQYEKKVNAIA